MLETGLVGAGFPCWLKGVREYATLRLATPLAEERFMWFLKFQLNHLGY